MTGIQEDIAFSITNRGTTIEVYGEKTGLYRFQNSSSTGKTYLCKILKQYNTYGEQTDGYDYYDYNSGRQISSLLGRGLKLVIIDRYDAYNGEQAEDIIKLSEECIVILSCKMIPKIKHKCTTKYIDLKLGQIVIR